MQIYTFTVIKLLGLLNFGLLCLQLATGLRWIKVRFGVHKKTGIVLAVMVSLHGLLAFVAGYI